jgi:hypothetical protein
MLLLLFLLLLLLPLQSQAPSIIATLSSTCETSPWSAQTTHARVGPASRQWAMPLQRAPQMAPGPLISTRTRRTARCFGTSCATSSGRPQQSSSAATIPSLSCWTLVRCLCGVVILTAYTYHVYAGCGMHACCCVQSSLRQSTATRTHTDSHLTLMRIPNDLPVSPTPKAEVPTPQERCTTPTNGCRPSLRSKFCGRGSLSSSQCLGS